MKLSPLEQRQIDALNKLQEDPTDQEARVTLYDLVRDYPGRKVSTNTAYVRMLRKPGKLKLHEACTAPLKKVGNSNSPIPFVKNPEFLQDLKSEVVAPVIAEKWGIHRTTVTKYRRDIREGLFKA